MRKRRSLQDEFHTQHAIMYRLREWEFRQHLPKWAEARGGTFTLEELFAEKDRFFWDLGVDMPQLKPIPQELELHEDPEKPSHSNVPGTNGTP